MFVKHFQLILLIGILTLSHQYSLGIDEDWTKSRQQENAENEVSLVNENYDHLMVDFLHSYFKPKQENGYG